MSTEELNEQGPFDGLLKQIAQRCIRNNWIQSSTHYFTKSEITEFNLILNGAGSIQNGYCFLDDYDYTEGMIRLFSGNCNPKWSFGVKDGNLWIEPA